MMNIQIKRGTSLALAALNPVLAAGEPCLETDTNRIKYGNGTSAWNDLSYSNADITTIDGNDPSPPPSVLPGEFNPAVLSGLSLWFESADSDSASVSNQRLSQWINKKNNAYASQTRFSLRPNVVNIVKNKYVLSFDGENDRLLGETNLEQNLTAFVVFKTNTHPKNTTVLSTDSYKLCSFDNNGKLGTTIGSSHYSSEIVTDSELVLNFNTPTITDSSPKNSTITTYGNAQVVNNGKFDKCLYLDGVNSYIEAPAQTLGTSDFTIEFWVKPTAEPTTSWTPILALGGATVQEIRISQNIGGGGPGFFIPRNNNIAGARMFSTSSSSMPLNSWSHVALVRQGTLVKYYINGILKKTLSNAGFNYTSTDALRIGYGFYPWDGYFKGYIDGVRVIKRAIYSGDNFSLPTKQPGSFYSTNVTNEEPLLYSCEINGTNLTTKINGVINYTGAVPVLNDASRFSVGSDIDGNQAFDGDIAAVVVYNRVLSTLEYNQVKSYLHLRWTDEPSLLDRLKAYWPLNEINGPRLDISDNAKILVVGEESGYSQDVLSSTTSQTDITILNNTVTPIDLDLKKIAYGNGIYVGIDTTAASTSYRTSTNGTSWTTRTLPLNKKWNNVQYVNDRFIIVGDSFVALTSTNGITWTQVNIQDMNPSPKNAELLLNFNNNATGFGVYTPLLLHFDGTNNSTSFTNSGQGGSTLVSSGGASISTANSKFGNSSLYLNNGYLRTTASSAFDFRSGDFTIEAWVNTSSASEQAIISLWDCNNAQMLVKIQNYQAKIQYLGASCTIQEYTGGTITSGTWTHYAVTRADQTCRVFLNGVQVITFTATPSCQPATTSIQIGKEANCYSASWFQGYIDELRVVKNKALYTANFTPPTQPLDVISSNDDQSNNKYIFITNGINDVIVSGTTLLMKFDGANNSTSFVNEASNDVVTRVGNPIISTDQSKFGGSSLKLLGGGRLDLPSSSNYNLEDGNYTIEFWYRPQSLNNCQRIITFQGSSQTRGFLHNCSNGSLIEFHNFGCCPIMTNPVALSIETWYHVALVKNGSTRTLYINGVSVGSTTQQCLPYGNCSISIGGSSTFTENTGNGYIDDFRIVKGQAIYTSNFTPPTQSLAATPSTTSGLAAGLSSEQSKFGGTSLKLNRVGSGYLSLSDTALTTPLFTDGEFTMECWFRANSDGGTSCLMSTRHDGNGKIMCIAASRPYGDINQVPNKIWCGYWEGGWRSSVIGPSFNLNTWYHVAMVVSKSYNFMKLYVDGNLVGSSGGLENMNNYPWYYINNLYIGRRWDNWDGLNQYFDGYIDDAKITYGQTYISNFTPPSTEATVSTPVYPLERKWQSVAYGNNKYVAISNSDMVSYSSDSTSWTNTPKFVSKNIIINKTSSGPSEVTATCNNHGLTTGTTINIGGVSLNGLTASTLSLMKFDGSNGSTTFIDSGPNQATVTREGDAIISTAQSKFGGSSGYFNGTGRFRETALSQLGTSDFTIEAWVWVDADTCNQDGACICELGSHSGFNNDGLILMVGYRNGHWIAWAWSNQTGGAFPFSSVHITPSTWTHIAMTRSGNTFRIFVNGVLGATFTSAAYISASNNSIQVGGSLNGTSANAFGGYIDEVHVIKGYAKYTSNFTVPSEPQVVFVNQTNPNGTVTITSIDQNTFTYPITGVSTFNNLNGFFYLPSMVPNKLWDTIVYGNNKFMLNYTAQNLAPYQSNTSPYAYSSDGVSWVYYEANTGWNPYTSLSRLPKKVAFKDNKFVIGGWFNGWEWKESSDGLTWSNLSVSHDPYALLSAPMAYTDDQYTFITSPDTIYTGDSLSSLKRKRIIDTNASIGSIISVGDHVLISGNQSDNTPIVSNFDISSQQFSNTSALFDGLEYLETELTSSAESFAVWIKIPSINTTNRSSTEILGQWAGAAGSWRLVYDHNNGGLIVDVGQNRISLGVAGAAVASDNWRFVAGSYDNNVYKLYMIIPEQNDYMHSTTATILLTGLLNGYNLRVGSLSLNPSSSFIGQIDNLALWDRAISESEVMKLYYNGRASNTL